MTQGEERGPRAEASAPERADVNGPEACLTIHATTVAHLGRALLIRGPSGAGKSALALELMARGAVLVADDRTVLTRAAETVSAAPPPTIAGMIEARGLGLLRVPYATDIPVTAVVDLDADESERLPPRRTTALLGRQVVLYRRVKGAHFAAALILALATPPIDPDAAGPDPGHLDPAMPELPAQGATGESPTR